MARLELGAKNQDQTCSLDGKPSVGLAVFQLPGSNAVATAERVRKTMASLKAERFKSGLDYAIVYDTTPFILESIKEVFKALRDAIILVALVVLLFLQNWRSTLIPLIAVPVSLIGTFAVMALLGFSLNNISLCGLVLAIGVVVDDAIVVVENVERWIEHGLPPREAAYKSMEEVTVAVIAIAFGLSAVFIPDGVYLRHLWPVLPSVCPDNCHVHTDLGIQFAHTQPGAGGHPAQATCRATRSTDAALAVFVRLAVSLFQPSCSIGVLRSSPGLSAWCLRVSALMLIAYAGLLGLTYFGFTHVPTGFVPSQDKGYLLVTAQLPDAASLERTQAVLETDRRDREEHARRCPPGRRGWAIGTVEHEWLELWPRCMWCWRIFITGTPRTFTPTPSRRAYAVSCMRRSRMPKSRCSARRRSTAWATPAGSN